MDQIYAEATNLRIFFVLDKHHLISMISQTTVECWILPSLNFSFYGAWRHSKVHAIMDVGYFIVQRRSLLLMHSSFTRGKELDWQLSHAFSYSLAILPMSTCPSPTFNQESDSSHWRNGNMRKRRDKNINDIITHLAMLRSFHNTQINHNHH